jgi:hypothetical protein
LRVLRTPPLIHVGFNRAPRWLVMSPGVILAAPPDTTGEFIADGVSPSHDDDPVSLPRAE